MTARPAVFVAGLSLLLLCASEASAVKRRAFVTSVEGSGDLFSWPGSSGATALARADSVCRARAAAGGLPNPTTYRAWLSTSTVDAFCHVQGLSGTKSDSCNGTILPGGGPWYLFNGVTQFTADLATLTGPEHVVYRPVIFDEFGTAMTGYILGQYWTGTVSDGSVSAIGVCDDWTSSSGTLGTPVGTALGGSFAWTLLTVGSCATENRLLCLEPGASEADPVDWQSGALVFVTSIQGAGNLQLWPGSDGLLGLAAGDAICRNLAAEAHLPSPDSFVAWLSDATTDAVDRLSGDGPYRRLDGFAIATTKAGLVGGPTFNSIHVDEAFAYLAGLGASWTGTGTDGLATSSHCDSWTSGDPADYGDWGYATISRERSWTDNMSARDCDSPSSLYCFSNAFTLFWDGFDYTSDTSRWSSTVP